MEYSENRVVEVAEIINEVNLTRGSIESRRDVIAIGESEVEIITEDGIRNCTNLTGNIILTFHTSLGKIDVKLYPDVQDKSKIMVEVSNKEEVLEKFEGHEEELGEDCELGNYCVYDAIERGYFERSGKLMRPEVISESNKQKGSRVKREESRRIPDSREKLLVCHKS